MAMKDKVTIEGRSMIFNIGFVILNLVGLSFLVMGYHESFEESSTMFLLIGLILMIVSIGGLILFQGRLMMSSVSRVLVGGLFIVSGLVKANDPLGFAYKLEEYFEDGALAYRIKEWFGTPGFSMEGLIDYALFLSVLICIAEIVLGVLTIIGGKIKLVSYLMLLMMVFFTFLTWHTANCDGAVKFVDRDTYEKTDPVAAMKIEEAKTNKELKIISNSSTQLVVEEMKLPQCVDDCGCFGDAMKGSVGRSLTPKESLWKDIVLMYLVIWIFVAQWKIKPNTGKENIVYLGSSTLVIVFFSWVFGWYFPIVFGLVSILGALWILRVGGKILGNYWGSALVVTILCLILEMFVLMYSPLKDYRAYAVGSNLKEKMNDGIEGVYENLLVYKNKKTGERREYSATSPEYTSSKIWENKDWEYDTMTTKTIIPTRIPSITDQFNPFISIYDVTKYELTLAAIKEQYDAAMIKGVKLMDIEGGYELEIPLEEYNQDDYPIESYKFLNSVIMVSPEAGDLSLRDAVINEPQMVLVSARNLMEANWSNIDRIKQIYFACKEKGIAFAVMCGASREDIEAFRKKHNFYAPFFVNDETEMKAISRSNPAMLVIEKGVVKEKYSHRSIPTGETFKSNFIK